MRMQVSYAGDEGRAFYTVECASLAAAKRDFYERRGRAGVSWVSFTEIVEPISAFDAALGHARTGVSSFHYFREG